MHDPHTFSSARGVTLDESEADPNRPTILTLDPPRHDELRALISRAFTPRRIAALEPSIRAVTRSLIDRWIDDGHCDFVSDFAAPLPAIVIADLLGVDREDREEFRRWSDLLIVRDPRDPESTRAAVDASRSLYRYFAAALDDRRTTRRDDLISALLDAEDLGAHLSTYEVLAFCVLLLVAGHETTTNLISNTLVLLNDHPEQRNRLARDFALLPDALEESLRFDSPVQALARTVTTEVELHGQRVQPGDKVVLLFGSANRDEREFTAADSFDITRTPGRHLAFGHGVHYCLGAALARLEARVAYEEILAWVGEFEFDGPVRRLRSGVVRGFGSLPIAFQRSTATSAPRGLTASTAHVRRGVAFTNLPPWNPSDRPAPHFATSASATSPGSSPARARPGSWPRWARR